MQTLQGTFDFLNDELEVILGAMKKISKVFPIASKLSSSILARSIPQWFHRLLAIHASKIERDRLVARSTLMGLS